MIRVIFLLSLVFETLICSAQVLKIENRNRRIRAGFENSIKFSLDRNFDSLYLRTSQGKCNRVDSFINLVPASSGPDTLFVQFFYRKKLVHADSMSFEVIKPEVFPAFGSELLQKKSLSQIKAMGGVIFYIKVNDYHWEPVAIKSYRFSVIRKDNFLFSTIELSNRYSNDLKEKLDTLIPGDKILITDIILLPGYFDFANCLPGVVEIE